MRLCNDILKVGERLFLLKRTIRTFNPEQYVEELKVLFNCDTLLKKDGIYYFCDEIKDVEILEETKTTT